MNTPTTSLREAALANLGLLLVVIAWGAFFPILELLLKYWDFYSATIARQVCGAIVLCCVAFLLGGRGLLPTPLPWWRILILGGVGVSIGSLMTSVGVFLSTGLSAAIISTTNPIGSALTAAAVYREPLGRGLILATLLSVVGGMISVMGGQSVGGTQFGGGEILIVVANVLWTWMSIAAQRWLSGFSQLQIAAVTVTSGALWLVIATPFFIASGLVDIRVEFSLLPLGLIAFAGIVPIAIGNVFWHYGVSKIGVVVASMYNNLLPAAALATTVLLGGAFAWSQVLGSLLIIAGVLGVQISAARRKRI
jgi:drug/metabolite transporter (DMT)-like permease